MRCGRASDYKFCFFIWRSALKLYFLNLGSTRDFDVGSLLDSVVSDATHAIAIREKLPAN